MSSSSSKRRPLIIVGGLIAAAVIGYAAFGVFGVHTLFIDDEVAEAAPTFTSATETSATESNDNDATTAPDDTTGSAESDEHPADTTTTLDSDPIVPEVAASGQFTAGEHPASGTANVLTDGALQRVLRLEEDFATDNGPDLNVYLAPSADVGDDFIDLGNLKGNIGSQNYEIPPDVDLDTYGTVVIWCVRFGVAFGSAELGAG